MTSSIDEIKKILGDESSTETAKALQWFFKTGPGEYGEGDKFIGVKMGPIREVAKQYKDLDLSEIKKLVSSPIHEHRMCALIIAANQAKKADEKAKQALYDFYLGALKDGYVNNWDLVDVTCVDIVGEYLVDKPKNDLYKLAKSKSLWDRRVAIIATFAFIKRGDAGESIKIADMLLKDEQDLIHKAVGWMLREVGKRVDEQILCKYLDKHAHEMPRTMLRYSLEKLDPEKRSYYMAK